MKRDACVHKVLGSPAWALGCWRPQLMGALVCGAPRPPLARAGSQLPLESYRPIDILHPMSSSGCLPGAPQGGGRLYHGAWRCAYPSPFAGSRFPALFAAPGLGYLYQ